MLFFTLWRTDWDLCVVSVPLICNSNENHSRFPIKKYWTFIDRAATWITLSFTPWSMAIDQSVVSVLLISNGNTNISRFLIIKYWVFIDRATNATRIMLFPLAKGLWSKCSICLEQTTFCLSIVFVFGAEHNWKYYWEMLSLREHLLAAIKPVKSEDKLQV